MMQSLIDEAESGKYNNKKTLSDRIQDVVQQRKLTSYMNNIKWREMLDDFIEIPQLSIMYKTLFDEINPEFFWRVIDDEYLAHMNMAVIEWFKIEDVIREYRKKGFWRLYCLWLQIEWSIISKILIITRWNVS